jgi:hypothetical protein
MTFLFKVSTPTSADFVDFLTGHRQQVTNLFNNFNADLALLRVDFARVVQTESGRTVIYMNEVIGEVRTQESTTMTRLGRATNNTCIQNLRNLVQDTLSLSGFRIGTCSKQFYDNVVNRTEPIYAQITQYQIAVNNLPIMFMAEMQGENVLNDEQHVIDRINARFARENAIYIVDFPIFTENLIPELERQLHNLNLDLSLCFIDIVNNFRIVATLAEERIFTICGQNVV